MPKRMTKRMAQQFGLQIAMHAIQMAIDERVPFSGVSEEDGIAIERELQAICERLAARVLDDPIYRWIYTPQ